MILRNSGSGSLIVFGPGFVSNSHLRISKFSNATTFSADYGVTAWSNLFGPIRWYQIRDNGTNRFFEYSYDGVEWITA